MIGYTLPVTCPECGEPVEHLTGSRVYAGSSCSAVVKCSGCRKEWQVQVALRPIQSMEARRRARIRERVSA